MGFAENYLRAKQLKQAEYLRAREIAKEDKLEKEDLDRKKFGGAFSNMMLEEYSFQGQFKSTPFGLEFEDIPGSSFSSFPSLPIAYSKYKKMAKKFNQEPNYDEFMQAYRGAEGAYGKALAGKFQVLTRAGHSNEAISSAILGNEGLTKSFNHFLGTDLSAQLEGFVPKKTKGFFGGAAEEIGKEKMGLGGLAAARAFGAVKTGGGIKAAVNPFGGMTSATAKKLSGEIGTKIAKSKNAPKIAKAIGLTTKSMSSSVAGIKKYIEKHGVKKLMSTVVKKAGTGGALKLLGRGTLGALLTGSGVGTAAGIALDAYTLYELSNIILEATEEAGKGDTVQEMLIGGKEPKVAPGTVY